MESEEKKKKLEKSERSFKCDLLIAYYTHTHTHLCCVDHFTHDHLRELQQIVNKSISALNMQ